MLFIFQNITYIYILQITPFQKPIAMKKIFMQLISLVLLCCSAEAQIPNASFENWNGSGNPQGWLTSNDVNAITTSIVSTTPGYAGSKSCKLEVKDYSGYAYPALLQTTFAENSKPASLHGWYKFTVVNSNSQGIISLTAIEGLDGVGAGGTIITTASSVFQEFTAPMYYTGSTMDSMYIAFGSGVSPIGTVFIIDDLSWGTTVSAENLQGKELTLEGVMQNPSSGVTDIIYRLPATTNVSLKIFDLNGRELKTLVNENQNAGRFKAQFNSQELTSGIYFCRLNAGGNIRTTKLVVVN